MSVPTDAMTEMFDPTTQASMEAMGPEEDLSAGPGPEPLDDDEISAIIEEELTNTLGGDTDDELSENWTKAMDYFLGRPRGDDREPPVVDGRFVPVLAAERRGPQPRSRPEISPAVNASPAPTVSSTSTFRPGSSYASSLVTTRQPSAPLVMQINSTSYRSITVRANSLLSDGTSRSPARSRTSPSLSLTTRALCSVVSIQSS